MKHFLLASALFAVTVGYSQTKLIHLKRHSGHVKNLKSWEMNPSNFGAAPTRLVRNANLDSVILISDKVAVMVTSETCEYHEYDGRVDSKNLWRAGKDTVYNHVLFNGKQTEDDIRDVLKKEYHFNNNSKDVVLIGFRKDIMNEDQPRKKVIYADTTIASIDEHDRQNKRQGSRNIFKLVFLSFLTIFLRTPL